MSHLKHILIIGNGRVAKQWLHYYSLLLLQHPHFNLSHWHRQQNETSLPPLLSKADQVFLAISDTALEPFLQKWVDHAKPSCNWFHFSGALTIPNARRLHPLMSFGKTLLDIDSYRQILLVTQDEHDPVPELIQNRRLVIRPEFAAKYHFYLSFAANLSQFLVAKSNEELSKLGVPTSDLQKLVQMSLSNALQNPPELTGPLARQDQRTIQVQRGIAQQEDLLQIYDAFAEYSQKIILTSKTKDTP